MSFGQKLKEKALLVKNKAIDLKNKSVDFSAWKLANSNLILKDQNDINDLIEKSKNKTFTTKEWEEKTSIKRSFLVIWDSKQDFFKEFLALIPVLLVKSFSQNISVKIADIQNELLDLSSYSVEEIPSLIIFEDTQVYKTITWEENIKQIIKWFSLDINQSIEDI